MKELPVLFDAVSVRAIIAGRKTMTRRVIQPQPPAEIPGSYTTGGNIDKGECTEIQWCAVPDIDRVSGPPPKWQTALNPCGGEPGRRLWIREPWAVPGAVARSDDPIYEDRDRDRVLYLADYENRDADGRWPSWRNAIYMPRWASRITLELTSARIERLQEIPINDIDREGIRVTGAGGADLDLRLKSEWIKRWDGLNAKKGFSWQVNPWVWVIAFKLVEVRQVPSSPQSGVEV